MVKNNELSVKEAKIKESLTSRTCFLFLLIGSIALGMMWGCAQSHVQMGGASGPTFHATPLGAMTTKEPQPFLKTVGRSPTSDSMGSQIVVVDLRPDEVWLIITVKVTSSEKVKLKNMADVVFVSPSGTSVPGYLEERLFSLLDPLHDKYDVVWDGIESERTVLPGISELKAAFQVLDDSVSQGVIKLLDADPVKIDGFLLR
jgi:hypothetical protein